MPDTRYADTSVKLGETYHYAIDAVDNSGQSALSAEQRVFLEPSPPPRLKQLKKKLAMVPRPTTLLWEAADRPAGTGETKARLPLGDAFDLACDPEADLLYVSSTHLRQILVLRASDGELLRRLGPRLGEHEIGVPLGIDVGHEGNIFVVDGPRGAVVVLTPEGEVRRVLTPLRAAGGPKPRLVDVAVLADGTACVTDNAAGQVIVFDGAGREVRRWKVPGLDPRITTGISKIAVTADGNLVITDGRAPQIYLCSPEGERLASFGERRSGVDGLPLPADVAPLADGHLLVADLRTAKILEFAFEEGEGVYRAILANSQGYGMMRGEDPLAVARDGQERIFVLDFLGNRVGAFRLGAYGEPR